MIRQGSKFSFYGVSEPHSQTVRRRSRHGVSFLMGLNRAEQQNGIQKLNNQDKKKVDPTALATGAMFDVGKAKGRERSWSAPGSFYVKLKSHAKAF